MPILKLEFEPDYHRVLDSGVSFDSSLQKRGHASHNSTEAVIELLTGLLIDVEVLSNFCQKCKMAEHSEEDTDNWMVRHRTAQKSLMLPLIPWKLNVLCDCGENHWQKEASSSRRMH